MKYRQFDWMVLLLCPALADLLIPWLKYRFSIILFAPFAILWLILNFPKRGRGSRILTYRLDKLAIWIVISMLVYSGADYIYANIDEVMKQVVKNCKKVESDCEIYL